VAPSSLAASRAAIDIGAAPSRKPVARPRPRKETAVNDLIYQIVITLGSMSAFDDVVTGVASVVLCICSAALFGAVFAAAI
jgi:hypothetical protein